MASSCSVVVTAIVVVVLGMAAAASAQLSATFYDSSCPRALSIIRSTVNAAVARETRMGASLLRLHFHDCFVQGCDASVLLADAPNFSGEQGAFPNANSLRGLDVVDTIKSQLEASCRQTVSCADILAVAARDSVVALGGPSYPVLLGRRDGTTAVQMQANIDLPAPTTNLGNLVTTFARRGFNSSEMVVLSGGHTIGAAQCTNFRSRIYGETNIDSAFAAALRGSCPQAGGNANLGALDSTPNAFDNAFFRDLMLGRGLLHSDQQLYAGDGTGTDAFVRNYASNSAQFFSDFAAAMAKVGGLGVLTGSQGQVRLNCSRVN
ncbi:peroxidase 2-like [Oryza brachyantha]|uniref:peroxidase 2-like n=1 Tax=Oryza brachyantha TaxID=4533 RepID=UPI001ADC2A1A|nr:peroxidase 2-like [Oryza brachyantha]